MLHRIGFLGCSLVKNLPARAGDASSIPEPKRSPAEGNGNPFQYSCLKSVTDRGAWQAKDHGVATVQHDLSTERHTHTYTHTHTHTHTRRHLFALTAFHTFKTVIPALLQ